MQHENRNTIIDKYLIKNMIDHYFTTNICGIYISIDDVFNAVIAGYPVNDDTFDACLYKYNVAYEYQYYFAIHQLAKFLPDNYSTINLEDDMGEEGLRQLKQRMKPNRMNIMYKATL